MLGFPQSLEMYNIDHVIVINFHIDLEDKKAYVAMAALHKVTVSFYFQIF